MRIRILSSLMALTLLTVTGASLRAGGQGITPRPVAGWNFDEGQVNLVLVALSGVWLMGWVAGDRWWGGAALGAAVAIKLLQAPLGLLLLRGRRWRMALAAAVGGIVFWLLAVPQYLPEYLFKVAPVNYVHLASAFFLLSVAVTCHHRFSGPDNSGK